MPTATTFAPALRLNTSLTASAEKRALTWLATHTPRAINSDHLTALGLASQFAAGAFYLAAHHHPHALVGVIACILLNWLGDSLDGTLARTRNQQRPRYGFYVDHIVDVLGALALMGGLAFSGYVHPAIAIAMLLAFLTLSAESYLATYTLGRFHMSQGLFGPTEIRLLLIAGNLALLRSPYSHILGHTWLLFDVGGLIATVCMFATALITITRHTRELYRAEPIA